ncbi:hypothetical protein NDU88_003324 [Pleurodeles waltl]|uniref:Uncharacterized protein n=1 Tax=Pleurodeles waltl TaxID=8319 RepID=A0AAV7VD15_PLEWA|nr:hypothetical protein NDU88_003324 [Pleurodeles waltl]
MRLRNPAGHLKKLVGRGQRSGPSWCVEAEEDREWEEIRPGEILEELKEEQTLQTRRETMMKGTSHKMCNMTLIHSPKWRAWSGGSPHPLLKAIDRMEVEKDPQTLRESEGHLQDL